MGKNDELLAFLVVSGLKLASQYTEDVDDPPGEEYEYRHVGELTIEVSTSAPSTAYRPIVVLGPDRIVRWRT